MSTHGSHGGLSIGFSTMVEPRGDILVVTITIVDGIPGEKITRNLSPTIDIAYIRDGKPFVRKVEELWKRKYEVECPICHTRHPLSLSFLNALVMMGEGIAKANIVLNNFALNHLSFN